MARAKVDETLNVERRGIRARTYFCFSMPDLRGPSSVCSRRRLFCLCYLCIEGRTRFDIGRLKTVYHRICARMNTATIFGSRVPRERIEHPWRDWREREREREEEREREMKNNGGERYFYLKKKNSSEDAFLEIETRREFSLSLSPCQIFNYGRSVQRYAAV